MGPHLERGHFRPDHERCQLMPVGIGGPHLANQLAVAQDKHAGRNRHHFVQLVTDEDHRHAARYRLAQRGKQVIRLLRSQDGCRFVKDEDPRLAVKRLEDLDPLPFADAQAAHPRVGMNGQPEVARQLFDPTARGGAPPAQPPQGFGPQDDVFHHRQVVSQGEMLVHHADAGRQCRARIAGGKWRAEQFDRALVGRIVAEKDVHERGLARAVFAQQRDHLAFVKVKGDRVVGNQRSEPLGDTR